MFEELSGKRVAWVLPAINEGSGGLQTIFRHVMHLKSLGVRCEVHLCEEPFGRNRATILGLMERCYGCSGVPLFMRPELDGRDVAVATTNITVKYVLASDCPVRCYFVQDFEPWFYAMGDRYIEAEAGYGAPLKAITIGRWLESKLSVEYGMEAWYTDFCADGAIYRPLGGVERAGICAIYQPAKDRRCSQLLEDALRIVHEMRPDVPISTYGSNAVLPGGFSKHLGLLSKQGCNRLYNESAVGLCISSSNPSRVPFEMMASGLPVVDIYRENNLYDFSDDTALLAMPRPDALASAVVSLLDNASARAARSSAGIALMSGRPADGEGGQFADSLSCLLAGETAAVGTAERSYHAKAVGASAEAAALYRKLIGKKVEREDTASRGLSNHYAQIRVRSEAPLNDPVAFAWCLPDQSDMQDIPLSLEGEEYVACVDLWRRAEGYGTYNFHLYSTIDGERQIIGAATALLATPDEAGDTSAVGDEEASRKAPEIEVRVLSLDPSDFQASLDARAADPVNSDETNESEVRGEGVLSRLSRKLGLS
ncbi:hypothetical protein [Olsenella intestinalis]|uniref:rhamnosyltransferase WsaF family glycosyltransferase n=1 Tax=Olsenella intestinalis TaxID=2930083 RepID=UPI00200F4BEE|nr:hypothetical protein [Olsenella intestinalis]